MWLDSWPGTGHVAVRMHRQGFDLQLTQYDDRGWRATFYTTGMGHSPTSPTGTAWARTPSRATQRRRGRRCGGSRTEPADQNNESDAPAMFAHT